MNARAAAVLVALLAGAASAQEKPADPPKPAAPAAPPKPDPAAKRERKTSPEAEAALAKYTKLLHFPTEHASLEMNSHCDVPSLGGELGCKFVVKGGDVALDIVLPEAFQKQLGPGQAKQYERTAAGLVSRFFKPFVVPAEQMARDYDMSMRTVKDAAGKESKVVDLVRFADGAAWDNATLTFDADGLLTKVVGTPNVDPNDQLAAANAGAEIESVFAYKKRGDKYTIESGTITEPIGETQVKLTYYDADGMSPLPRQLDCTNPVLGELTIFVHDYVIDGKPVAATVRKDEPKPAPVTPPAPPPTTPKSPEPPKTDGK